MNNNSNNNSSKNSISNSISFQQFINQLIYKVKQSYNQQQLQQFNELLNQLPKKIKQINADPYLFVFQYIFKKQQLIGFGLKQIDIIIQDNLSTKYSLSIIQKFLRKSLQNYPNDVVNIMMNIKQPTLQIFDLFFQIYSTVLLPEDIAMNFRQVGYLWLIKIFNMKQSQIPLYMKAIFDKIGVFQMPGLISVQQEQQQLIYYLNKIMINIINKVQDKIQLEMIPDNHVSSKKQKKGKYLYCFMCQNPADFYCKDTKVSICSSKCKKDHLKYISQAHIINQKYHQKFKIKIEEMLLQNWYTKRSPALSVDYLTCIYIFSQYQPNFQIQHHKIVKSPIMIEKVWLLYGAYYQKKEQMFQHIFAGFLNCKNEYLQQMAKHYFLDISLTHRIIDIYYNYDYNGRVRLIPSIIKLNQNDKQYCSIFISSIIQVIFGIRTSNIQNRHLIRSNNLITIFNQSDNPIQSIQPYFNLNQHYLTEISIFLLINYQLINKQKFVFLLDNNQQFIRKFLYQVTLRKSKSTIDELIRQVFYFININISDKIYRLLEILYQVYDFKKLGNQQQKKIFQKNDALFQYFYFIIMLNTELHNPNLQKKPTLSEIIERAAFINTKLVNQNTSVLEGMYQRIKNLQFNQQSLGVLRSYQIYKFNPIKYEEISFSLLFIQNYQAIQQIFSSIYIQNSIIYKLCSLIINYPEVCSIFLKILLERLQKQDNRQDQFLLQKIKNIIQQQPNAVNLQNGWKIIFKYILQNLKSKRKVNNSKININFNENQQTSLKSDDSIINSTTNSNNANKKRRIFQNNSNKFSQNLSKIFQLDLSNIVISSSQLKNDNFIYFFKDFCQIFLIDLHFKDFQQLIYIHKNRLDLMANGLMASFRKVLNPWNKFNLIKFISNLPQIQSNQQISQNLNNNDLKQQKNRKIKSQIILLMLKQIQLKQNIEELLIQLVIYFTNIQNFIITNQIWQYITHMVLKFKSQQNQTIIEELMKHNQNCQQFYESIMIQKTLNSIQPQLISKDLLKKLQKLQPYIKQLSDKVLKMFILKQNIIVIQRNIQKFFEFHETFYLFNEQIKEITDIKSFITYFSTRIFQSIQQNIYISSIMSINFLDLFLSIISRKQIQQQYILLFMSSYFKQIKFNINSRSYSQKTLLDRSVIIYQTAKIIYHLNQKINNNQLLQKIKQIKILSYIKNQIIGLKQRCWQFNYDQDNIKYRINLTNTFTFKKIQRQYKNNTQNNKIIISLLKQQLKCKYTIWKLSQILTFDQQQIQNNPQDYQIIDLIIENTNEMLNLFKIINLKQKQLLSDKIIKQDDTNVIHIKDNILRFRQMLKFIFQIFYNFQQYTSSNKYIKNKQKIKNFIKLQTELYMNILLNGVFSYIQIQYNKDKNNQNKSILIIKQTLHDFIFQNIDFPQETQKNIKQTVLNNYKQFNRHIIQ